MTALQLLINNCFITGCGCILLTIMVFAGVFLIIWHLSAPALPDVKPSSSAGSSPARQRRHLLLPTCSSGGSGEEAGPPGEAARGSWGLRPAAPGELGRFPPDARAKAVGERSCRGRRAGAPGRGAVPRWQQEARGVAGPRPAPRAGGVRVGATAGALRAGQPRPGHAAAGGGKASAVQRLLGEIHPAAAGESSHRPRARGAETTTRAGSPLRRGARCPRAPAWGGGSFVLKNLL